MTATCLKYFFMTICSFYIYYKLLHLSISKKEFTIITLFSVFFNFHYIMFMIMPLLYLSLL